MSTRIVVIGNGQFAANCLKLMMMCAGVVVPLVIADPELLVVSGLLPSFCRKMKLPFFQAGDINAPATVEAVAAARPDFLFSAYNMRIIREPLLSLPRVATVNFHNGPLPRYRGVNVYSWAIINGEADHGVTWHLVDKSIDTGDILGQRMFPLTPTDTPISLLSKGFRAGADLLQEILPDLLRGTLRARQQDDALATYYSKRDVPNGGEIRFEWSFEQIERFVRGLDFRPFENGFTYPFTSYRDLRFHPQTVRLAATTHAAAPGRILRIDDDAMHVQAADAVVELAHLLDHDRRPVSPRQLQQALQFDVGGILPGHAADGDSLGVRGSSSNSTR